MGLFSELDEDPGYGLVTVDVAFAVESSSSCKPTEVRGLPRVIGDAHRYVLNVSWVVCGDISSGDFSITVGCEKTMSPMRIMNSAMKRRYAEKKLGPLLGVHLGRVLMSLSVTVSMFASHPKMTSLCAQNVTKCHCG